MKKNYRNLPQFSVLTSMILLFIVNLSSAQAPQIQWARCFGGSSNDRAKDIHRTADSGYVVCGFTGSSDGQVTGNNGGIDGWVIKLDVAGNLLWEKTYGGSNDDALNAIRELNDGGYIAVGYTASSDSDVESNHGGKDFWVVRTNSSGTILWEKTFGGTNDDVANDIATTADTGFVVAGYTFSDDGDITNYKGDGDGWVIYLDTVGALLRQKDKGGHDYDEFKSVITTENGGFLLVGISYSNSGTLAGLSHGGSDAWVARLSKFGTDQWNALFGDSLDDGAYDVHENESNQFVVSGHRDFSGQNDSWLFTVDSLGSSVLVSESTHGGTDQELDGASIEKTPSNYIVSGSSNSSPSGDKDCLFGGYDFWMYNTLSGGAITWQKCMGGTNDDISSRAIASPDGSIGVCGWTNSTDLDVEGNHGDYDFWVLRLLDGCDVIAGFTYSQLADSVSFTNTSFDGVSFLWSFGDGSTSTEINPTHVYAASGSYTVCLIASSLCASDTMCTEINLQCDTAVAGFSSVANNLTLDFSSTSANATSWQWDFGDGNSSSDENPSHTYSATGNYEVCLIASNSCSADTFCSTIEVACALPASSFTYTESGNTVFFTSTSVGATSWKWRFGDATNSNQENPTHTYADSGTYTVCLIVSNECGKDTLCQDIHVGCLQAHAHYNYTQGGLTLSFDNTSTNSTSWSWSFGDGDTSSLQNPIHSYAEPGDYEVCLVAYNDCSSDSLCQTVTIVCVGPVPGFSYTEDSLSVSFTDLSIGATSWSWSFGDGGTSTDQNPVHEYLSFGTYEVCLVVTNDCGSDSTCQEVLVCPPVTAAFDYSATSLTVSFSDLSSGATSWEWTFGDGNSSTEQNPTYTYSASGTYTVCLTVSNDCNSNTSCTEITVECVQVSADFSSSANGLFVSFSDLSAGATSWQWSFGDGNTSNSQNPTNTYALPGTYTVCLIASNDCSSDSFCTEVTVECIFESDGFDFAANGLTVSFTDLSFGATSWDWNFGDGNTSNDQNPSHTYLTAGTYTVCLIVSNVCISDTFCQDVTVECAQVIADFTSSVTNLTVQFADLSVGATSWQWTFGDGGNSNSQNPSYTYSAAGTYQVCLIASNECSSDTTCTEVTVECAPFEAAFSWNAVQNIVTFTDESAGAISWFWDFDDGNTSTEQNPTDSMACDSAFWVCLTASDGCSSSTFCDTVQFICIGISEIQAQENFNIYPNPFNDVTTVSFSVNENSLVTITLTDLQGRLLSTLLNENLSVGNHSTVISKKNLAAGTYLIQMKQGGESVVRKLVIE